MATPTRAIAPEQAPIPTFTATIGGIEQICADARFLHAYLQNGDRFAGWMNDRLQKYGFEEGHDYELISGNTEIKSEGGFSENTEKPSKGRGGDRRSKDYRISLDMAKELSMVENNARGREARRYFIAMERKALGLAQTVAPVAAPQPEPQPAPSHTREPLNAVDTNTIRRIIYLAGRSFQFNGVWSNACWRYLRETLQHPSPQPFYVDQLPQIANTLSDILAAGFSYASLVKKLEQTLVRRVFKKYETANAVLRTLEKEATTEMNRIEHTLAATLPDWLKLEVAALTDRRCTGALLAYLGDEQPDFFSAV